MSENKKTVSLESALYLAKVIWPGHADEIYGNASGVTTGRGDLLVYIDPSHPLATDAMIAALLVLSGESVG